MSLLFDLQSAGSWLTVFDFWAEVQLFVTQWMYDYNHDRTTWPWVR